MIAIIGAGPVGNYAGYMLAKNGYKVKIFEEHEKIGKPVQCTGITTNAIEKAIKIEDDIVVNKVNIARVFSPSNDYVDIKMSKADYVFDRCKLDNYIGELAESEGVEIVRGKRFIGYKEENNKLIIDFTNDRINADYLIGADGVNSSVSKAMGNTRRRFLYGTQARAELNTDNARLFETYMGMGDFAWVVPENDKTARIGIIGDKESATMFRDFLAKRGSKVIEYQGGLVPLYDPRLRIQKGRVMLIGDAATQVKATTYGGIVPGMLAAKELARDIDDYEKNVNKSVGKELRLGLYIRKLMNNFSNKDYNYMLRLCKQRRIERILNNSNRDYPTSFLLKLLIYEPRFLKYGLNLLR